MTAPNEAGLGLFDDAASAVGNFPSALRGYDRSAVDDYVRSLEKALVQTRRRASGLDQQVGSLNERLTESIEKQRAQEIDFTNLGTRATEILRLAEEQAREVADQANEDAERAKETARREADRMLADAARAGGEIKANGITEIEQLRARGQDDIRGQVERARADAEAIVAAARREAEALQLAADHEAQTLRQNAYLDTEQLRREVELEVTEVRQSIATEREAALGHLRGVHEESVVKTSALLAEATEHHRQATERLGHDIAEATRIRAEAMTAAEQARVDAAREAEERIRAARKQAAAITDRTQQEFSWRKQQLRRETDLLGQRKAAVLSQLASLSALAEQTAHSFPDMEELEDYLGDQDDRTVVMPAVSLPALPPEERAGRSSAGAEPHPSRDDTSGPDTSEPGSGGPQTNGRSTSQPEPQSQPRRESTQPADEASTETRVFQPVQDAGPSPDPAGSGPSSRTAESRGEDDDDTMQVDGDATVLVPPSQLPAGTAHLRNGAEQGKS